MPRRLLTSELFRNERVAELDFTGRLFFVGLITNADDDGRLKGSPKYLKALIFPYDNITAEQVKTYRDKCNGLGIAITYNLNGSEYICLPGWEEHQTIRSDRYKKSTLPPPPDNQLTTNGLPNDNQVTTNGMLKLSKVKLSKDKLSNRALKKYPPHFIDLRKKVFEELQKRRQYKPRQPGAEAKAISEMLSEDFSVAQILEAYDRMKKQPFFQDKNLSMMQVRKDIHEVLKNGTHKQSDEENPDKFITGKYGNAVQR